MTEDRDPTLPARRALRLGSVIRVAFLIFWCWSTLVSVISGEWELALSQGCAVVFILFWMSEAVRRRKAEEVVVVLRNVMGLMAGGHYEVVRKDDDA